MFFPVAGFTSGNGKPRHTMSVSPLTIPPKKHTHTQKKTTGTLRNGHTNSHQGSFDQENDLTPAWVGWQRRLIHMIRFPTQSEHLVFQASFPAAQSSYDRSGRIEVDLAAMMA